MEVTLEKSALLIQASWARVLDLRQVDSQAGANHQPSIDPSTPGQSLHSFSSAWTDTPCFAGANGAHRPTLPSGSDTSYFAGADEFPEEHHLTLPSRSESRLPSPTNFQFGSSNGNSDASLALRPPDFDYHVPQDFQAMEQWLATPTNVQQSLVEYWHDSASPLSHDTTHLGDADHFLSQLPVDNVNLNEQNNSPEPASKVDEDLMSQPLEAYRQHPEGNTPNYPHGVASNSLRPVFENVENNMQSHCKSL
ncbi:hypothetical protein PtA15_1A554 [Puccinia triticina]|uniref:Uncharacterized protein n=1 Tax=Puccinia triticina TaxID=208348 RepID=A0ABY7C899_9BASI|nr:uncharacterized protein PtA15_1A554 [Puccinia triticina]WAQ81214.1 hypothetical protein PtA15_1A554 [Puccinia triticina]